MNTKEMKRFLMAAAVILSMLAVSCTKEGAPRFKGNYTFKTSGTVTVSPAGDESAEPQKLKLLDENGQMDVVVSDKNTGEMIVAMNILGGSVLTFNAVADGKTLTITPFSRQLTIPVTDEGSLLETAYPVASVTVSGYAERYADALMFFPIIGIITGYLGDFVKSFPWIIAFSLGTSLIYAVTGRHGGADTRLWSAAKPLL